MKVVYSKAGKSESESSQGLPEKESSQLEFLKTKLKLNQECLKGAEKQVGQLRQENDKLRNLNADYVNQLNQLAQDKYQKIEKIVVTGQFFEQKNIDMQLKNFVKKMTSNFSGLEKSHSKLIDHCRVMEHDIQYYKGRVMEAEDIIETLNSVGKTNISELMEELKNLQNQVDYLSNELQQSHFELSIKEQECERKQQEIDDCHQQYSIMQNSVDDIKTKQNRLLSEHIEKSNQDAKLIYQLKLKSDFLEHERRLAYQDCQQANIDRNSILAKTQNMEHEISVLRSTTDNFMKKNNHIFNLAGLPKMEYK